MPTFTTRKEDLYFWGNHKVIPCQGRYFDTSYNAIYNRLEDMALYHVLDEVKYTSDNYLITAESNSGRGVYFVRLGETFSKWINAPLLYAGPTRDLAAAEEMIRKADEYKNFRKM